MLIDRQVKQRPLCTRLAADASYLIVGGMGGIGRSLCEWMVERGARHLIVLSRNARIDSFFADLSCDVRPVNCDVSDKAQLMAALAGCQDMPPIRGVVQAAMILQVSPFLCELVRDILTRVGYHL